MKNHLVQTAFRSVLGAQEQLLTACLKNARSGDLSR